MNQTHYYSHRETAPVQRKMKLLSDKEYVEQRLEDQINWHKRKSQWNRNRFNLLKNIESFVAALVPLSLGTGTSLFGDNLEILQNANTSIWFTHGISALSGVYISISSGFFELDGYEQKAKDYERLFKKLESIRYKYLSKTAPYNIDDAYKKLVIDVENALYEDLLNHFNQNKQEDLPQNNQDNENKDEIVLQ